jgi:hypothetical protein
MQPRIEQARQTQCVLILFCIIHSFIVVQVAVVDIDVDDVDQHQRRRRRRCHQAPSSLYHVLLFASFLCSAHHLVK